MPDANPIARSDQALISAAAGDILKSAGPTAVPVVAIPGVDYLQPDGDGSQLTGITQSQVSGLTGALAAKADDANTVHKTINEIIAGIKSFLERVRIGMSSAGSANAQLEIKAPDASTPIIAGYTSLGGTAAFLVDAAANLRANNAQTFAASIAAPVTVADAADFALFSMVEGTGSGLYDISLTLNGSGFSQTKRYLITTTWSASTTWRTAVPISSTGVYEGNDCDLDFRQTTYQLEIRLRRVSGSTPAVATLMTLATGPYAILAAGTGAITTVTPPTEKFLGGRTGGVPGNFDVGGWVRFGHMADADAPNDSDYFSTTQGKRAYKDASGVVHALY